MALNDLTPVTRMESILNGDEISPVTREEYFWQQAASEVPKPTGVSDAGKVVTVNAAGSAYELDNVPEELPAYTAADSGKVLALGEGSGGAVEPKWENVQTGGGGGFFPVTISGTSPETLTSNKTYAEIVAAITDGLLPVASTGSGGGGAIIPCITYNASAVIFNAVVANVDGNAISSISSTMITVTSDNSVTGASAVRNFS